MARRTPRPVQLALAASVLALHDAGIDMDDCDPDRLGVHPLRMRRVGCGMLPLVQRESPQSYDDYQIGSRKITRGILTFHRSGLIITLQTSVLLTQPSIHGDPEKTRQTA